MISPDSIPAPRRPRNPFTRSVPAFLGLSFLLLIVVACLCTLPWTLARVTSRGGTAAAGVPRYDVQYRTARHLPPSWWWGKTREASVDDAATRLESTARAIALEDIATARGVTVDQLASEHVEPTPEQIRRATPMYLMGTDLLGRDLFMRCLAGGGISLGIGLAAALLSVFLGTMYGALAGYIGGRTDAVMMRIVDVLYGLPYVLLVVLLAVAAGSVMEEYVSRQGARAAWVRGEMGSGKWEVGSVEVKDARERLMKLAEEKYPARVVSDSGRVAFDLVVLLVAIGGVSWLTMARVIRGQVLSLKNQPFVEAARAMGVPVSGIFMRHLLPNLVGPIIVYATLTVPQAILQESFLSFLGIGVRAPMPSWGNLAADGLGELNPIKSHWWLLLFPALLLSATLLALNFVGEALREALDPKRVRR